MSKSLNLFPYVFLTLITFPHKCQYFQIVIENEKNSTLISELNEIYKAKDLRTGEMKAKINNLCF